MILSGCDEIKIFKYADTGFHCLQKVSLKSSPAINVLLIYPRVYDSLFYFHKFSSRPIFIYATFPFPVPHCIPFFPFSYLGQRLSHFPFGCLSISAHYLLSVSGCFFTLCFPLSFRSSVLPAHSYPSFPSAIPVSIHISFSFPVEPFLR